MRGSSFFNKTQTFYKPFQNIRRVYCACKPKQEVNNMNKNDQEFLVQKIRAQYTEKESTELDALRALDAKVRRPADVFAYIFGSIGAIVMGSGMSLVMTDIAQTVGIPNPMVCGIVTGIVGLVMAVVNYPLHKRILGSRRKKYAAEILALSDTIMKE